MQQPPSHEGVIKNQPLVSIVTVVYQGISSLEGTIKSVIDQTYKKIEYVVIDGGSKDGTQEIIKKYGNRINYWVSEPDHGIYDAMNKGIRAATGDWIIFLNAGDLFFESTTIEKFCEFIGNYKGKDPDLVYGEVMMVWPSGIEKVRDQDTTLPFLLRNMINHQSMFYSRSIFKSIGMFDTTFKLAADFDHLARMRWGGCSIVKFNTIISRYRLDGQTADPRNIKEIWRQRIKIYEKLKEIPFFVRAIFWVYAHIAFQYRKSA